LFFKKSVGFSVHKTKEEERGAKYRVWLSSFVHLLTKIRLLASFVSRLSFNAKSKSIDNEEDQKKAKIRGRKVPLLLVECTASLALLVLFSCEFLRPFQTSSSFCVPVHSRVVVAPFFEEEEKREMRRKGKEGFVAVPHQFVILNPNPTHFAHVARLPFWCGSAKKKSVFHFSPFFVCAALTVCHSSSSAASVARSFLFGFLLVVLFAEGEVRVSFFALTPRTWQKKKKSSEEHKAHPRNSQGRKEEKKEVNHRHRHHKKTKRNGRLESERSSTPRTVKRRAADTAADEEIGAAIELGQRRSFSQDRKRDRRN
jgi:hypothetical protein